MRDRLIICSLFAGSMVGRCLRPWGWPGVGGGGEKAQPGPSDPAEARPRLLQIALLASRGSVCGQALLSCWGPGRKRASGRLEGISHAPYLVGPRPRRDTVRQTVEQSGEEPGPWLPGESQGAPLSCVTFGTLPRPPEPKCLSFPSCKMELFIVASVMSAIWPVTRTVYRPLF